MSQNVKKARPTGGAAGRAAGLCDRAGQQSQTEYITRVSKNTMIFDLLPIGAENAIPRRELMQRTGLTDRQLRKLIEQERIDGALILSTTESGGGYFRHTPGDAEELRRYITSMESRAKATFYVLKAARSALAEIERTETQSEDDK